MKRKVVLIILLLFIVIGILILSIGGKRSDIMLSNYTVSDDGNEITINVAVASSMGYVRSVKEKQGDSKKYLTFYQTYGINSRIGAKNEFTIHLPSSCTEIYFYAGDDNYDMVLQKDIATDEWNRVMR